MLAAFVVVISIFIINLFYLFQGTGKALVDNISEDRIEKHITNNPLKPLILAVVKTPLPLPENYVLGISDTVLHQMSGHRTYFLGQYSRYGLWYYFPAIFLLKVSVFLLALIGISLYVFYRKHLEKGSLGNAEIISIFFILVFFTINLFSSINIGIRHILPIFPFVIFLCAKSVKYINKRQIRIYLILILFFALSSILSAPHYISFYNEIIGSNGYVYALDSNYDWGQDLKALSIYLKDNGISSVKLKYFGTAAPEYYGIHYEPLECGATHGIVAVSADYLQGLIEKDRDCHAWLKSHVPDARIGSIFVYRID